MKKASWVIFLIGIAATFYSVTYDATVYADNSSGSRIYNNGLLNDRTNYVIVSCFIMLIGAIWMVVAKDENKA